MQKVKLDKDDFGYRITKSDGYGHNVVLSELTRESLQSLRDQIDNTIRLRL